MAQQCLFIAVVDDDAHFCAQMRTYLEQAAQSLALTISVECFTSPLDFVSDYSTKHDILFLDIEMPDVDGLSVARRIRQMDNSLCIIFVTSMAQYAIRGYEVSALDFVVKPVAYATVANKLQKAALYCESRRDADVMLSRGNVAVRVRCSEIFYIEKEQNYLVYHTQGEEFRQRAPSPPWRANSLPVASAAATGAVWSISPMCSRPAETPSGWAALRCLSAAPTARVLWTA